MGTYIELLAAYDVYIAIGDNVDTWHGDSSNEMVDLKNLFNEWYARDCSKKIRAVSHAKGNAGEHLASIPPYGYIKDPANKKLWVLDEVAAPVVTEIFRLFMDGENVTNIAKTLSARRALTPRAHKQHYGIAKAVSPAPREKRYLWLPDTITAILENKDTGATVNFKSRSKSFKNKRRVQTERSEQKISENTHPAIVDKAAWELVRQLHKKRRPTKMGEMNMLSGYLYCSDCGARMTLMRAVGKKYEYFYCGRYRAYEHKDGCTSHIIRADAAEKILLERIRAVTAFASEYESE